MTYDRETRAFATRLSVVREAFFTFDEPGTGLAAFDPDAGLDVSALADMAQSLAEQLLPGPYFLAGASMGGLISLLQLRRHGVGRQLQEAQQAWAKDHGYEYVRCECMNHQREFIHFAVTLGYDIVGIRWDSTHADNLIVFEKNLIE